MSKQPTLIESEAQHEPDGAAVVPPVGASPAPPSTDLGPHPAVFRLASLLGHLTAAELFGEPHSSHEKDTP